jgi:RNA polymerase sigma factor for flagellar operon FliA
VGLVHHVARQLGRRLSTAVDIDELVSAGTIGLIQAVDAFDPKRGLSFSTFAVPRIRGAMLDELRRQDHVPRSVRRRTRELGLAHRVLAEALRREPTEAELARCLRVPPETLRRWELDAQGAALCSLDQRVRSDDPGVSITLAEAMSDERAASPDDRLTLEQEVAQLRRAIEQLKPQERTVLALSFFEELKLQEIAAVLGLSVCRISQIRSAALARLRVSLRQLRAA